VLTLVVVHAQRLAARRRQAYAPQTLIGAVHE
jgi:hypothetical protein